ncbi:hypothetical protein BofuT4_uP017340.1 [Botrytis cinerea T4]|uniref:Uncharacterized protein n=1 Tax=Botryotinia fuckeliana (strain T4) TaxID=999810 RepID=G2YI91_BOTF4|nr:hypothetical protein BofuT4_uP017340.1 [Botrytis cinerea T4]
MWVYDTKKSTGQWKWPAGCSCSSSMQLAISISEAPPKSGTLSDPGSIDTGTMIRHVLKSPTQQHTQHTLHMVDPTCIVLPYPLLTCTKITE